MTGGFKAEAGVGAGDNEGLASAVLGRIGWLYKKLAVEKMWDVHA